MSRTAVNQTAIVSVVSLCGVDRFAKDDGRDAGRFPFRVVSERGRVQRADGRSEEFL